MTFLAHIADRITGRPLLITPEKVQVILSTLADRVGVLSSMTVDEAVAASPQASRFAGVPSNNGPYRVTREGVAIVPVMGTLVNRGAWIGAQSGLTSYEGLSEQLRKAREDASVRSILLDINTPGGEAGGCFDLADQIREIDKAKPVVALANDMACSAGYAIASAAREIFITKTAIVGSIGVVLVHFDHSKRLEKEGIKPTIIHAGARKADGNPYGPLPDDVSERLKSEVETLREMFVASVVAGRQKLKPSAVKDTEAGVFMGEAAVKAGLADGVATFESVLKSMSSTASRSVAPPAGYSPPKMETNAMTDSPAPAAQAPTDAAIAQARAAGAAEGRAAERARIGAILNSEEAKGRSGLAIELATTTDLEPEAARKVLAKAAIEQPAAAAASQTSQLYAAIAAGGGVPKVGQLDESGSGKGKPKFGTLADGMRQRFQS